MKKIFDKMVCRDCDLFQPEVEDKGKGYCWKYIGTKIKTMVSEDDGCPSFHSRIDFFVKK